MGRNKLSRVLTSMVIMSMTLTVVNLSALRAAEREHPLPPEKAQFLENLSGAFERVADTVRPAVVNISSIKKIQPTQRYQRMPDLQFHGPFREFFGDDFFDRFFFPRDPQRGYVQQGLGTGVIIDEDGYILTNNHVIDGADEITVKLHDGRTYKAEVEGTDDKTDLALIKIKARNLASVPLGDSDEIKIGQWVVAVGNPFGLTQTVTAGIISAKGRTNLGIVEYEDFIQTDAAINPGNSGGPLVNLKGEVIGINAAIFSKSGGYMGIGFAIPINMVKSVIESLKDNGYVVRGWLGVVIQDLDESLAESFGYQGCTGALVSQVTADSPAAKAGLQAGDIIIKYGGKDIANSHQLRSAVSATMPGSRVAVELIREGRHKTVSVEIGKLDTETEGGQKQKEVPEIGLSVRTLTRELAREIGVEGVQGVLVTDVDPLSPAGAAGIKVNDVILDVYGKPVSNADEFWQQLRKHDIEKGVRLTVQTGSYRRFVLLKASR